MRGKTKCSKSSLKSERLEPRSNDGLCRTLICRQYISESIIPTYSVETTLVLLIEREKKVGG